MAGSRKTKDKVDATSQATQKPSKRQANTSPDTQQRSGDAPPIDPKTASTREFLAYLKTLGRDVDPVEGFFGPGSVMWKVGREPILFMSSMRALLLQIAHPAVAEGVSTYSNFRTDPIGRAYRTFSTIYDIGFGDRETATKAAARVHAVHSRVKGTLRDDAGPKHKRGDRYDAHDKPLLLWVHATLIDGSLGAYQQYIGPLTQAELDEYYEQTKLFAKLFGLNDNDVPKDYVAFQSYFDEMIFGDELAVSPTAREMSDILIRGTSIFRPLGPLNRVMAAATLPPHLRTQYGLHFGRVEKLQFEAFRTLMRQATAALPESVRYSPHARAAYQRLEQARTGKEPSWLRQQTHHWLQRLEQAVMQPKASAQGGV